MSLLPMNNTTLETRRPLGDIDQNSLQRNDNSVGGNSRGSWWSRTSRGLGLRREKDSFGSQRSTMSVESAPLPSKSPEPAYVVIVGPKNASINSMTSQLGGGALRKVLVIQQLPQPVMYVEFVWPDHAHFFRQQVNAQRCLVNGVAVCECDFDTLQNVLATEGRREEFKYTLERNCQYQINMRLQNAVPQNTSGERNAPEHSFYNRARRTLQLSRQVRINARLFNVPVSPPQIMEVFGKLGVVLQVRPMFMTHHVGFIIEYATISSAFEAWQTFRQEVGKAGTVRDPKCVFKIFEGLHSWNLQFVDDYSEHTFFY